MKGGENMDNNQNMNQGQPNQQGYDPNAQYNQQGYPNQGYDPNAYAQQNYQSQGYDPNAYAQQNYQNQGYDPNAYAQQNYQSQGYDPNAYAQQNYQSQGYNPYQGYSYDPNLYYQQSYQTQGYDPNMYYQQAMYQQQIPQDPNNPMRLTVSPSNPSTSSNNITLNLDSLYERINNEIRRNNEPVDKFISMKNFMRYLIQNSAVLNVYSYLADVDTPIVQGTLNTINNNTISVQGKVVALNYISYIKFVSESIEDIAINSLFYEEMVQKSRNPNINNIQINDFYNLIQSRKTFNQYVSIVVTSTFLTPIEGLTIVDVNDAIGVFKDENSYYIIPLEKIITMQ